MEQQLTTLKEYMTIEDMCNYFQMSKGTLDNWRKEKGLKDKTIGRIVLFEKEEIERFIEMNG